MGIKLVLTVSGKANLAVEDLGFLGIKDGKNCIKTYSNC